MVQRTFVALGLSLVSVSAAGQGRGAAPPPTDTVAPAIAGVVAAGTPVHVIKDGFNGSEGPIAAFVGSLDGAAKVRLREAVQSAYLDGEKDGPRSYAATAWVIRGTVP